MRITTNIANELARIRLEKEINTHLHTLKKLSSKENKKDFNETIQCINEEVTSYQRLTEPKPDGLSFRNGLPDIEYFNHRDAISKAFEKLKIHINADDMVKYSEIMIAIKEKFSQMENHTLKKERT